MRSKKPQSVPAFYNANEPLQLPLLSSQVQMVHRTISLVKVTATEELTASKPPIHSRTTDSARAMAPVFRVASTTRGTTPQLKSKGVTFATSENLQLDCKRSEHSPAPSESSLSSLESKLADGNKIPKPAGEAGRPGRGGYNLEEQIGWGETEFKNLKCLAHKLIKKHLDVSQSRTAQSLSAIKTVKQQMLKAYPMLDSFESCWPVDDLICFD
ncbi:hypothetical protein JVT61DRAFT_12425 [Boletus reticuloceps]|uniref:Uncharacterized protein n=1 Tax=Boletus reticuloceps TaxID=495285 RepID=A0A8I2YE13_9AGAM|nr:hypothetical protein JVT61DRAFT_12425 [Boletus reticuloceps]